MRTMSNGSSGYASTAPFDDPYGASLYNPHHNSLSSYSRDSTKRINYPSSLQHQNQSSLLNFEIKTEQH